MSNFLDYPKTQDLTKYGLKNNKVQWNLSGEELQKITLKKEWEEKPKTELFP